MGIASGESWFGLVGVGRIRGGRRGVSGGGGSCVSFGHGVAGVVITLCGLVGGSVSMSMVLLWGKSCTGVNFLRNLRLRVVNRPRTIYADDVLVELAYFDYQASLVSFLWVTTNLVLYADVVADF